MSEIYSYLVVLVVLCIASTGCAQTMPIQSTYVPVTARCSRHCGQTAFGNLNAAAADKMGMSGASLMDSSNTADPFGTTGDTLAPPAALNPTSTVVPNSNATDDAQIGGVPGDLTTSPASSPSAHGTSAHKHHKSRRHHARKSKGHLTGVVNINTATASQLALLPGIGPALAARIVRYRSRRKFTLIRHLRRVRGIGKAKFHHIAKYVVVRGQTTIALVH